MYVETFLAETFEEAEQEEKTPEQELEEKWKWLVGDIVDSEIRLNTQQVLENAYNEMVKNKLIPSDFLEALHPDSVADVWPNLFKGEMIKKGEIDG